MSLLVRPRVNKCVWSRIVKMEMDYNLKTLDQLFQVLWLCLATLQFAFLAKFTQHLPLSVL